MWRIFEEKEEQMKTMIRSVCAVAAVAVLTGCGVPKEQHQQLQDKYTAAEQQLAQAKQELASQQNALQQKDSELAAANQQVQAMLVLLRKKQQDLDGLKAAKPVGHEKATGVKTTPKATSKGKSSKHTTKKPASAVAAPSGF